MPFIQSYLTVAALVICNIKYSYTEEQGTDAMINNEEIDGLVRSFRFRRHIDPSMFYQQSGLSMRYKRERGFLSKLKRKILSFLTGRSRKYVHGNIQEDLEDESINNLEYSPENFDNKIHETTSVRAKIDKNISNLELISRLQKMLANYDKKQRRLLIKAKSLKNKKWNLAENNEDNNEIGERKKRHLDRKGKERKSRGHHYHTAESYYNDKTTASHFILPGGSYVHKYPKTYNDLEETKKRDKLMKSILTLGSFYKRKASYKENSHTSDYNTKKRKQLKVKDDSFSHEHGENSINMNRS